MGLGLDLPDDITMETLEDAFDVDRALVFGIGGSGDVVGAIPTARLLETHDVEVTLGGTTWEPVPYDSKPGPRSFDEIENLTTVSETVGIATEQTVTTDGLEFSETKVARYYSEEVVLIDLAGGAVAMRDGLATACDALSFDLVVGVDAGGDVLASGNESGLRSPVTDAYGLVALDELAVSSVLGVFGYGSDGELSRDALDAALARIAAGDGLAGAWGLTKRIRDDLEGVLDVVDTEASRLPVEAARGNVGSRTIRGGEVSLTLSPIAMVTFYFDPGVVADHSDIAATVRGTTTLEEATEALRREGYPIEFDIERNRLTSE